MSQTNGVDPEDVKRMVAIIAEQRAKIATLQRYVSQYQQAEQVLMQQENKISLLMAEIERVNHQFAAVQGDCNEWKSKYARLELSLLEYRQMERTNRDSSARADLLAKELQRCRAILNEKLIEVDLLSKQSSTQEDQGLLLKYLLLSAENQRLNKLLGNQDDTFAVGGRQPSRSQHEIRGKMQ